MAHLVREHLQLIWVESKRVVDDVVRSRCDGSLADALADQVEIVALRQSDCVISHSSRGWIFYAIAVGLEDAHVDAFVDDDEGEFGLGLTVDLDEELLEISNLICVDVLDVSLADAITVEDNALGQLVVLTSVGFESWK